MLQPLLEALKEGWDSVKAWQIVRCYEGGVILRRGHFSREIKEGWNWKWPLMEEAHTTEINPEPVNFETQSLTTKDGVSIMVSGVVLVKIRNVKKALLECQEVEDMVAEVGVGVLCDMIMANDYEKAREPEFRDEVKKACHKELTEWGIDVIRFKFQDFAKVRTLRVVD